MCVCVCVCAQMRTCVSVYKCKGLHSVPHGRTLKKIHVMGILVPLFRTCMHMHAYRQKKMCQCMKYACTYPGDHYTRWSEDPYETTNKMGEDNHVLHGSMPWCLDVVTSPCPTSRWSSWGVPVNVKKGNNNHLQERKMTCFPSKANLGSTYLQ